MLRTCPPAVLFAGGLYLGRDSCVRITIRLASTRNTWATCHVDELVLISLHHVEGLFRVADMWTGMPDPRRMNMSLKFLRWKLPKVADRECAS